MAGSWWGNLGEWLGIPNQYSAAGQERTAAETANTFAAGQQSNQQAFAASEAQKQRDYETQMSNTAYQRAVTDMKAAGINPILAYQQGGASTPASGIPSSGQASASKANIAGTKGGGLLNSLAHLASSAAMIAKILL